MSQRDLVAELRSARVAAPPEVRERVRLIAAAAPPARRGFTWRRALVVVVPAAAAVAAAVVLTRPSEHRATVTTLAAQATLRAAPAHANTPAQGRAFSVPAAKQRVQVVGTSLTLRTRDISGGVKHAVAIATSLGGYALSVHADLRRADLALKVPRTHVSEAMTRLGALGTITAEHLDVQDKTAALNATDREIARVQRQIARLRAQGAPAERIDRLVARVEALQRAEASTRRNAHYATVKVHLRAPTAAAPAKHGHGPLHGVLVALTWLGIGAVYALAVGLPVVAVLALVWLAARLVRRRRENALLSRP